MMQFSNSASGLWEFGHEWGLINKDMYVCMHVY